MELRGFSIGVFDPKKDERDRVYQLFNDDRITYYAPANYTSSGRLYRYLKQIIDTVAAKEIMKTEHEVLSTPAKMYGSYRDMTKLSEESRLTEKQKKEFLSISEMMHDLVEGKTK